MIIAANHRSFLDPFVIAACTRRPFYFVAKKELFLKNRLQTWFLNSLGAFPIDRGTGDEASMATARRILERGDGVMIFPEGTRVRPGPLGSPAPRRRAPRAGDRRRRRPRRRDRQRRGAPRLAHPPEEGPRALRPGAAASRRSSGRRRRSPRPSPTGSGRASSCSGSGSAAPPPLRRVAIIGAGSWGTSLAIALARGGAAVELGCRTEEQARELAAERENRRYLPGRRACPTRSASRAPATLDLREADLVCLAVPTRDLPVAMGEIGDRLGARTSLLVSSKGLVPPAGELPTDVLLAPRRRPRRRLPRRPGARRRRRRARRVDRRSPAPTPTLLAQLRRLFADAGFDVETTRDVVGVDLAGVAKNAAVLAATTASVGGPNASGAAAGKVFSEIAAYAGALGAQPETWTGLAGAGDLVASVVAAGGRNRRAGELLARGVSQQEIRPAIGQVAEALDALPLLVTALEAQRVRAPATRALAAVVSGEGSATGVRRRGHQAAPDRRRAGGLTRPRVG